MEIWYKELGFWNNPFSIKPAAFHNEVYGYDLNNLFNKIDTGSVVFIEGKYGKGKTTILKKIIKKFGGEKKIIYYNCSRTEDSIDVDGLIKGRPGFFSKLFGAPNDMILLLDETQDLPEEDGDKVLSYLNRNFKTIVLVSNSLKEVNFGKGLRESIGDNIIKLGEINEEDVVKIIRKRVGSSKVLSDDVIKMIYSKSDKNPRKLLKNCEEICKYAFEQGDEEVKEEHIKEVLE